LQRAYPSTSYAAYYQANGEATAIRVSWAQLFANWGLCAVETGLMLRVGLGLGGLADDAMAGRVFS